MATGNPILDSANNPVDEPAGSVALDNNKPSLSSPLASTDPVTAADLDPTSQAVPSTSTPAEGARKQEGSDPVENVMADLGGAAAVAPAAAVEAIASKVQGLANDGGDSKASTTGTTNSTASSSAATTSDLQAQASRAMTQASNTATNLASQASQYAQQAVSQLPASVSAYLPSSVTGSTSSAATHHSETPITSESRETTSAPIVDSRTDRPVATHKALVPEPQSAPAASQRGSDITQVHRTGNFEAAGSLQATHNPDLVQAQSDIAVRAENGEL